MGVIEGGHNMKEVLLAMQQSIREHMALFAVIFLVLCVAAAAAVYLVHTLVDIGYFSETEVIE